MRRKGKMQNSRNPNYCNACDQFLETFPGGAEVEMSMLYVDIRQSTQYAEGHEAAEVSERINAFLSQAVNIITDNDGFVMAFYGDCIVAVWPPGFSGEQHALKAQQAALALARENSLRGPDGNAIPVGVAVNTGNIFIGTVTALQGTFRDVSVFGSNVNLTARMAARAAMSQVLATAGNIIACGKNPADFPSEEVELKGFSQAQKIYRLG